jgi:hypothetical protein
MSGEEQPVLSAQVLSAAAHLELRSNDAASYRTKTDQPSHWQ